jgi:hypothetical protein
VSKKKPTNPKDAFGCRKAPLSALSGGFVFYSGLGMAEGGIKYGRHNYRVKKVRASIYFDALQRHAWGWWEGEDIDPDSGLPHLVKLASSVSILIDASICDCLIDDRPPAYPKGWMKKMNEHMLMLKKKYPKSKAPYTQKKHGRNRK